MKKNILMLINGFGIEQQDSYNVYSKELMPYLDEFTTKEIFVTIPNKFLDYKSAYRQLSMGINESLTHILIEKNISTMEYPKNPLLVYIINQLNKLSSNCHVICYWDSNSVVNELIAYVKEIEEKTSGKIFLHFILNQKSVNDYKSLVEGLNKLSYEFGQRVKIAIVSGEDNLTQTVQFKELMKCFLTEAGEKWKDIEKKMEVFTQAKTKPYQARTFAVNYGFRIEEKDQIIFFNYYETDVTNFRKELFEQKYRKLDASTIGLYSLFPVTCEEKIPFMYNYALAGDYFLKNLLQIKARCLILDTKERCMQTNYYLTGLRNEVSENLKYKAIDDSIIFDSNKLLEIFKEHDKELYIINYELDSCNKLEDLKEKLANIDKMVGFFSKYAKENKCGFFLSSLYGLEKEMYNAKAEICKINFYSKVPVVIQDEGINLTEYTLNEGNLNDLMNTILFNINNNYDNMGLLKKKSKLFSIFYKKPKKVAMDQNNNVVGSNNQVENSQTTQAQTTQVKTPQTSQVQTAQAQTPQMSQTQAGQENNTNIGSDK